MICPTCGAWEKHADYTDCLASMQRRVEEIERRLDRMARREKRQQKEKD